MDSTEKSTEQLRQEIEAMKAELAAREAQMSQPGVGLDKVRDAAGAEGPLAPSAPPSPPLVGPLVLPPANYAEARAEHRQREVAEARQRAWCAAEARFQDLAASLAYEDAVLSRQADDPTGNTEWAMAMRALGRLG
jgi:hypothetical protein